MKTKYEIAFSGKGNVSEVLLKTWESIQIVAEKHKLKLLGPAVQGNNLSLIFNDDVGMETLKPFQAEISPIIAVAALDQNLSIGSAAYGQMFGDIPISDSVPLSKLLPEKPLTQETKFREQLLEAAKEQESQKDPKPWERN